MFDDKDSLLDTWMYVLEDLGSERSALAKDKIYTHINLKQMTIIRLRQAHAVLIYGGQANAAMVLYADGDEELPDLCQKLWKMLDGILPNWPNLDNFSISCFVVKSASFFCPLVVEVKYIEIKIWLLILRNI
ncbi:hypothetical protein HanPSC8_Chr04g0150971 [Helianthus annuus]|nr:hypothetical protein HanIR_Chr04g0169141 [Helianthus annuus]KAJ0930578.1 hypothetical protein HanPSC8_Chr04g0150971 [Helianthus annuus]